MNIERIDGLIEETANRISEVLKSTDFIGVAEMTKALAELMSARALFK